MPDQIISTLNRISQLGRQAQPGVAVAATRKLNGMAFPITPNEDIENFRPPGSKYDTGEAVNREWSEGTIGDGSGLIYNEVAYPLAQVVALPVIRTLGSVVIPRNVSVKVGEYFRPAADNGMIYKVTVAGITDAAEPVFAGTAGEVVADGTAQLTQAGVHPSPAVEMIFDSSTWDYDEVPLYTMETGDRRTGRSYRAADCFFTGLTVNSAKSGSVGIDGDLIGAAVEDPFVLTPGVAEDEMIPATPAHLNVYMDETPAMIGATLLDGNFSAEWSIGDKAGHVWWHNRALRGPSGRVETPPDATAELTQADGGEVDDLVAALRAGMKRFFRYEFKGPEISGAPGINHLLEFDFAGMVNDNRDFDDEDGVWAVTLPMAITHSSEWGRAHRARVISTLADL